MIGFSLGFSLSLRPMRRRDVTPEMIRIPAGAMFLPPRMTYVMARLDPALCSQPDESVCANLNPLATVDDPFARVLDRSLATVSLPLYTEAAPGFALDDQAVQISS